MAKNTQSENAENGSIGQKMKDLRKEQNLTLAEVAAVANVSISHLSQIERNKTTPSLMSVASIAEALNISVRELFESPDPQVYLQRTNYRVSVEAESQLLHATTLTAGTGSWQLQVTRLVLQPGFRGLELPEFTGEALGFVLDGVLGIELDDEIYELQTGDSIHFDASVRTTINCQGEHPCIILWCSSPPLLISSLDTL